MIWVRVIVRVRVSVTVMVSNERADAIFATLKTIVDDIVTCGRALVRCCYFLTYCYSVSEC